MEDLETSATLEFHGARYVTTVQVQQQLLHVQVEASDCVWTGRFPAADIEQLTRQTGNSKRFPVFVHMLLTALNRRSDSVFLDLLTAADLDLYRQRKLQPGTVSEGLTSAATASNNGKRYLILTYAVEFDRVHYPLPLTQELSPSAEVLQRTIRRLRQQLSEKENLATNENNSRLVEENSALREENRCLKNTLKQYCGDGNERDNSRELQQELQASIEENKELIALYQQFRDDSEVETTRLRTEIKQLRVTSQQNDRTEVARQEQERLETRRKIKDSNAAVQETLAQMVQMKAQLEESQLKNRELLRQLAIARAQAGQQSTRQRSAINGNRSSDLSSRLQRGRSPSTRPIRSPAGTTLRQQTSSALFPAPFQSSSSHYGPSDDEDAGDRTPRNTRRGRPTTRPAFRRFDPTAYQQEKERKLREARARSNSHTRPPRSNGGYSSDSSAGGYSSTGSRGSKTSSRSTRSRMSKERQREVDTRLSSPKRVVEPPRFDTHRPRASNNSPLPRSGPPRSRSLSRGRSPSPTPANTSRNGRITTPRGSAASSPRKPSSVQQTPPQKIVKQTPIMRQKQKLPQALLDTSADSFSDIDDRLTALQQFLREAKQGGVGIAGASTAA